MYVRPVRNKHDLKDAYWWLRETQRLKGKCDHEDVRAEYEMAYKKAIRDYNKYTSADYRCIKNYGIDGGIFLIKVPENIRTDWGARQWFMENEYREYVPSPYDCTGQTRTNWWKLVKRQNEFYIYHSVSVDV